ncbi:MAG: thiol peroxidase [Tissierellia bacterium]|nr:thiol peroxidase [Tissierellia bacterium]
MTTFGGNPVTISGKQIQVGDVAPDFKALNNDLSEFNSQDYKGSVRLISVVPSLDTGVCSIQTKTFEDRVVELGDNVHVITISNDLPFAQARFCQAENIDKVHVVSDYKDLDFGMKYGFVIDEFRLLTRGIVVIDESDKVTYVEYVDEVTDAVNFDKAIEAVKKLV